MKELKSLFIKASLCLSALFLLGAVHIKAQTSAYTFENTLADIIGSNDGIYIYNEVQEPVDSSIFVSGLNGLGLRLKPEQGIILPNAVIQSFIENGSIEISFNLLYTFYGGADDDGYTPVFTLKRNKSGISSGFLIAAVKDFNEDNPNSFELDVLYSEGRWEEDGGPPATGNILGPLPRDEWVPVSMIFDMNSRTVTAQAGGKFSSSKFDDNFDIEVFADGISSLTPFFGWENGMLESVENDPNRFGADIIIDDFKIYTPRQDRSLDDLKASLNALTDHITGVDILDESSLQQQVDVLVSNYEGFYFDAKIEYDAFLQTYDANFEPFFEEGSIEDVSDFAPESFVAFLMRQEIFDNAFVPGKMEEMAGTLFPSHTSFPGPVSDQAPRLDNQNVEINSTYILDPGYTLVHEDRGVRRPTGYYAAAGELITITVPQEMVGQGIQVYIGAHVNDLTNKIDRTNRFLRISKEVAIDSTVTKIANPFGGGIYFRVPPQTNLGWQTVTISGAVKSPFYRLIPGYETNIEDWDQSLSDDFVKWFDLESEYVLFTLPTSLVNERSPAEILPAWDNMWKAVQIASGRPIEKNRSEYLLIDRRGPTEGISAGYPMASGSGDAPFVNPAFHANPFRVLDDNFIQTSSNGEYVHEMGHNMGFPTLSNEQETIVQLVGVPAYNVGLSAPIDSAFKYVENENHTRDLAAVNWMIASNFINNEPMNCDPTMPLDVCDERRYQMRGGAKYVDIAVLFGWEGLGSLFKVFYDDWVERGTFAQSQNFITEEQLINAAAEGLQLELTPLFHFWGSIPDEQQVQDLSSYPNSIEVYDRIQYYKALVPSNQEAFRPWYDQLIATVDPVHYDRINWTYDNYDSENIAQAITDQIDSILLKYYGTTAVSNEEDPGLPSSVELRQNYPNPFNPATNIEFSVPARQYVRLEVYDMLGRKVSTLVDDSMNPGNYTVNFDASQLSSGVYVYRLEVGASVLSKKMMLVK